MINTRFAVALPPEESVFPLDAKTNNSISRRCPYRKIFRSQIQFVPANVDHRSKGPALILKPYYGGSDTPRK